MFKEEDHPRDKDGKFTDGNGTKAEADDEFKSYPDQNNRLEKMIDDFDREQRENANVDEDDDDGYVVDENARDRYISDLQEEVEDVATGLVWEIERKFKDGTYDISIEDSRSWQSGPFPAKYIEIVKYEDEDQSDEIGRIKIRLSDGHANKAGANDIEINYYDLMNDEHLSERLVNHLSKRIDKAIKEYNDGVSEEQLKFERGELTVKHALFDLYRNDPTVDVAKIEKEHYVIDIGQLGVHIGFLNKAGELKTRFIPYMYMKY